MSDGILEGAVQAAISVAILLIPIYIGYLLNEWSKRREFERDRKYERKFQAYETCLKVIRVHRDFGEYLDTFGSKDQVVAELSKVLGDEKAAALWVWFQGLMAAMVSIELGHEDHAAKLFDSLRSPDDTAIAVEAVKTPMIVAWAGLILQAGGQFREAIATLRLSNAPPSLLVQLEDLISDLGAHHPPALDLEDVDKRIEELERMMREDLAVTIRKGGTFASRVLRSLRLLH